MMKLIFILTFLLKICRQECNEGCLKCTSEDICLICDTSNFFVLSPEAKNCVKKILENCEKIDVQGNCILCNTSYYTDNGNCVQVQNEVQQCQYWKSQNTCSRCQTNYALQNAGCVDAVNILDCKYHNEDTRVCDICQKEKIKSIDQKYCLEIKKDENCQSFNFIDCGECDEGYFLDRRGYQILSNQELKQEQSAYFYSREIISDQFEQEGQSNWGVCVKISVQNCLNVIAYDKCEQCENGYFLDNKQQCIKNPEENLNNCSKYKDRETCVECSNKYYMNTSGQCVAQQVIEKCEQYSRTIIGECIQCQKEYFVDGGSVCKERVLSKEIENCILNNNLSDQCQECDEGFKINSEGSVCLQQINFCNSYEKTKTTLKCLSCINKYVLNDGQCDLGSIKNCLVYKSLTQCEKCDNFYYLDNDSQCQSNDLNEQLRCQLTDSSKKNFCVQCSNNRVLIDLLGICKPVEKVIQNCEIYADSSSCLRCKSQFTYLSDGSCRLGTIKNCTLYHPNKNQCLACQIDHKTNQVYVTYPKNQENNQCVIDNSNIIENCEQISLDNDKSSCKECQESYYPYQFETKYSTFCVSRKFYLIDQNLNLEYCLVFNSLENKCLRCEIGKVVSTQGICVDSCEGSEVIKYFTLENSETDSYIKKYLQCEPSNQNILATSKFYTSSNFTCLVVTTKTEDTANVNYCIGCGENQVGYTSIGQNYIGIDFSNYPQFISNNYSNQNMPINSCFSTNITLSGDTNAYQTRVATYKDSNDNLVPASLENCKFIKQLANDTFGCGSCKHGYSGFVVPISNLATSNLPDNQKIERAYFIDKCQIIVDCISNVYYQGLGFGENQTGQPTSHPYPLSYYVSCHKCANNTIPTYGKLIKIEGDDVYIHSDIHSYGYQTQGQHSYKPQDQTELKQQTSCQPSGLGLVFVLNCAVQEIVINKNVQATTTNTFGNPRCVACLPGFKPVWKSIDGNKLIDFFSYVSECQQIQNCDTTNSLSFNRCDQCRGIYSLVYESTLTYLTKGEECRKSDKLNCLIYDFDDSKCVQCFKGYALNKDGICDEVILNQCRKYGFIKKFGKNYIEQVFNENIGCEECSEEYIGVFFLSKQKQCILSSDLQIGNPVSSTSNILIQNCLTYGSMENFDDRTKCVNCMDGYVSTFSGKKCYKKNEYILNCRKYNESATGCQVCDTKYYLDSQNQCQKGTIKNCLIYRSQNECSQCENDFILLTTKGQKIICFAKPELECDEFDTTSLSNSQLLCNKCQRNYYNITSLQTLGSYPLKFCIDIPNVDECIEYNNYPNILDSNLNCTKCKQGYYVKDNICYLRKNQEIQNCKEYDNQGDYCSQCIEGYYVDQVEGCKVFPQGIKNCEVYINEVTCSKCKPYFYLQNNVCNEVPKDVQISNCVYYDTIDSCTQCDLNFFLKTPKNCIQSEAKNCLTYEDEKNCSSCSKQYGLLAQASGKSCVKIDIANCQEIDIELQDGNFTCKLCNFSFYRTSEGKCISVPQLIDFCGYYSSASTCQQCLKGYVLSKDQKKCRNDIEIKQFSDPHCSLPFETSSPICNVCQAGHSFSNHDSFECVKCSEDSDIGCMICDFQNPSQCLLCASGYHMDKNEKCIKDVEKITEVTIKSVKILQIMLMILLVWL